VISPVWRCAGSTGPSRRSAPQLIPKGIEHRTRKSTISSRCAFTRRESVGIRPPLQPAVVLRQMSGSTRSLARNTSGRSLIDRPLRLSRAPAWHPDRLFHLAGHRSTCPGDCRCDRAPSFSCSATDRAHTGALRARQRLQLMVRGCHTCSPARRRWRHGCDSVQPLASSSKALKVLPQGNDRSAGRQHTGARQSSPGCSNLSLADGFPSGVSLGFDDYQSIDARTSTSDSTSPIRALVRRSCADQPFCGAVLYQSLSG